MSKPGLIMVAGWAHSEAALNPLAAELTDVFEIQTISTASLLSSSQKNPHHHHSPHQVSGYARALYAQISAFDRPPSLLAWSMGALVALETLSKLKPHIDRLFMIGGTARFCATEDYPCGVAETNLRAMMAGLQKKPREILSSFFQNASSPDAAKSDVLQTRMEQALSQTLESLGEGLLYLRQADLRDALPAISTPTLIVHGAGDKIIPPAAATFLKEHIAGAESVIHAAKGHALPLNHPTVIARDIRLFMEKRP